MYLNIHTDKIHKLQNYIMFEKLEELAKNNKKISDFHIRAGSPLAYRQTGEIIMVQEVLVKPQDLKDLLQ